MMAKGKRKAAPGDVATNRQAAFRYNLIERFECGIVLTGTEVKSLRDGNAQLKDSYATIKDGEVWLIGAYIAPYPAASRDNHDPERTRKLLMHRGEIEKLTGHDERARVHARADADLLLRRALTREGRDRAGARQGPLRQARDDQEAGHGRETSSGSCARSAGDGGSTRCLMVLGRSA